MIVYRIEKRSFRKESERFYVSDHWRVTADQMGGFILLSEHLARAKRGKSASGTFVLAPGKSILLLSLQSKAHKGQNERCDDHDDPCDEKDIEELV